MKCFKYLLFLCIISLSVKEENCYSFNNFIVRSSENYSLTQIEELIHRIPEDELSEIKNLFENLFRFNELAFTLYGDKPVSFCSLTIVDSSIFSKCTNIIWYVERILKIDKIYNKEWITWQKYSHLFTLKNFILLKEDCGVVIVNKRELTRVISHNLDIVQKKLGNNFDINNFLENIQAGQGIFNLISKDHEIFGIILGFGSHNSKLFQRREEILNVLEPYKIPTNLQNTIAPSPEYFSIQEELKDLWKRLEGSNNLYFPITDLNRVSFVADSNNMETKKLKKKFELQRQQIKDIYSQPDWFEQMLLQLTLE